MKTVYLKIKFQKGFKEWGKLQHEGGNSYTIIVDENAGLCHITGTLLHEFFHLIFYMFFPEKDINETREHRAINKVDRCGQKAMDRYLEGK